MNNLLSVVRLVFIFSLFLFSCKKSDNRSADISHLLPSGKETTFFATVNDVMFESSAQWIYGDYSKFSEGHSITILGRMFSPTDTFQISANYTSEDLLDYSDGILFNDTNLFYDHRFSSGFTYIGGDGSYFIDANSSTNDGAGSVIAINTISQTISGTFSFLYDNGNDSTIQISSGYFTNVPYQ